MLLVSVSLKVKGTASDFHLFNLYKSHNNVDESWLFSINAKTFHVISGFIFAVNLICADRRAIYGIYNDKE